MTRRALIAGGVVIVVGLVAAALALAYGSPYGTNNQVTYLLDPLSRTFPELYHRDWFVSEMHHYHIAFAWLTAPLYALDADGAIAFGIAQLVTMVATYAVIYKLVACTTERARLTTYLLFAGLLVLGGARSLGGSYLFAGYLQPSSLAVLGWLVALVAWVRDRPLAAGLALGLGAVFHLNYAVLGVGMFGLAELSERRDLKRLAMLLGPSLVVVLVFLPAMIASSHATDGDVAMRVLVQFAFPVHFKPVRIRHDMWSLAGWLAVTWALRGPADRLWRFAISGMALVLGALLVASIPPLLFVTRLFVWRIAPLPQLAGQLVAFASVRGLARRDAPRPSLGRLVVLAIGLVAIVVNAFQRPVANYPDVIVAVLIGCGVAIALRREVVLAVLAIAVCGYALVSARTELARPMLFSSYEPQVSTWARTATPTDAVFLVPPYRIEFRLMSRRAIVVDTKSPPMYLDELVAWYRRLCAIADAPELVTLDEAGTRYDALAPDKLVHVARAFGAGYVLVQKTRTNTRLAARVAYEDAEDVVYELGP